MRQSLLTLSLAPAAALAATGSLKLFYPVDLALPGGISATSTEDISTPTPTLSIVSANAATTVASLGCGPQTTGPECIFNGFTYTEISTTVYKFDYTTDVLPSMPLTVQVDCTSKSDVQCAVSMPNSDKISIEGFDKSEMSSIFAAFATTQTYAGNQIAFITAPVTAGAEKLSAAATGGATPKASGSPTGTASAAPAEQTKNVARKGGVEVAVLVGVVGVAAAQLL